MSDVLPFKVEHWVTTTQQQSLNSQHFDQLLVSSVAKRKLPSPRLTAAIIYECKYEH